MESKYLKLNQFQFHYGSIKRYQNYVSLDNVSMFQFHYGSIKSCSGTTLYRLWSGFNSTMVRLKAFRLKEWMIIIFSFNSTMVRLKVEMLPLTLFPMKFQFHYGSIKSRDKGLTIDHVIPFQFHYGSIKRKEELSTVGKKYSFNSTMVRLKVNTNSLNWVLQISFNSTMVRLKVLELQDNEVGVRFQFHYGSIKRLVAHVFCGSQESFNSTMVRLKAKPYFRHWQAKMKVSIPLWFD